MTLADGDKMDRVKDDHNLSDPGDERVLERPVIIVEQLNDGNLRYLIFPEELDSGLNSPESFGVLLSDLLDHIASTYRSLRPRTSDPSGN